ncbi:MAG: relaxase/mobilization nuclease domain-containing protein [Agriterribacter sp.]
MVAVIHQSQSLNTILNYNEQKVKEQKAVCLKAENYPKHLDQLSFSQKLNRLKNQALLNERTKINGVHISLNFDVTEHLPQNTLTKIAREYMDKIGFGAQPYLVYQHNDAGHEHIHIVTTNIKPDGKRISLHNLGRNESEKARKEIEIKFGLVRADGRKIKNAARINPIDVRKAVYGKSETRRVISNILNTVLTQYNYTSIPELNALLMQYNVMADRGGEDSRIFRNRGIVYRILNDRGEKVGIPIKASLLHNGPTLSFLEEQFIKNLPQRAALKRYTKNAVDWLLSNKNITLSELKTKLATQSIDLVIRQNKEGLIYGITYVDHKCKVVFNGSDLGPAYSAKGILLRCKTVEAIVVKHETQASPYNNFQAAEAKYHSDSESSHQRVTLAHLLQTPSVSNDFVPTPPNLKKKRRRRTR